MTVLTEATHAVDTDVAAHLLLAEGLPPDWAGVASRAHAILTQSLQDELLDELVTAYPATPAPLFSLPPVLAG